MFKRRNNEVFEPGIWRKSFPWILSIISIALLGMWICTLLNSYEAEPTSSGCEEEGKETPIPTQHRIMIVRTLTTRKMPSCFMKPTGAR